jgi:hypothetical protein
LRTGNGLETTASNALKIGVFAAAPTASSPAATDVKRGFYRAIASSKDRSWPPSNVLADDGA